MEKTYIEKNETCLPLSAVFGTMSRNFEKKRYVVIFPITRSGRMQKNKKKKKNFYGTFFFADILFPVIKRGKR